ncbi:hypothetical protein [Nonomuraea indica]|uniref:hypothetical protein n=1 Tax=Nonomuraea indica TaxID=1581193 RepID=UPI000C7C49BF|nr:hypothetical protein [Nonomuraea indica]
MVDSNTYGRALLVSSDVKGYGSGTDKRHEAVQRTLVQVQEQAASQAGLRRIEWVIQPGGDGELACLPGTEHEPAVAGDYVMALNQALAAHNAGVPEEERVRLRVALHYGVAYPAAHGLAGQAVVEVSRLVNWPPLKRVLEVKNRVNLVLILSDRVFRETVLQGHTTHKTEQFLPVRVREKEFSGDAWVWAPGEDLSDLDFLRDPEPPRHPNLLTPPGAALPPRFDQKADVITNLNANVVDARGSVFGVTRERS